jgi:NAD(P)H-flavin reductase
MNLKKKIPPGSYFFVCFWNISRLEYHPVSLLDQKDNNLIFAFKIMGKNSWTNKFKKFDNSVISKNILYNSPTFLQGPYHHHMDLKYEEDKFKYIIIVAGGIGITPYISICSHITSLYQERKIKNLKRCSIIWTMKDALLYEDFEDYFKHYNQDISDINIYITQEKEINQFERDIRVFYHRPNIHDIITKYTTYGVDSKEIAVLCCGPRALTLEAIRVCADSDIPLIHEIF